MRRLWLVVLIAMGIGGTAPAQSTAPTFFDIQREFYRTHVAPDRDGGDENESRDGEWMRFKRWEWFMTPRVGHAGNFFPPGILLDELNRYDAAHARKNAAPSVAAAKAQWTALGPKSFGNFTGANGGIGRVSCVRFHPTDKQTMFIGTPEGGLWKTTDAGSTWSTATDHLPNLGVTDVAIDPRNPNVMYIATGDGDDAGMYGNPYSYGVLKTTDGGATWNQSGLQFNLPDHSAISRIVIHPSNSNIVMVAASGDLSQNRGIWRSTDAGGTWTNVSGGAVYSIEFKPGTPNTVYASGYGNFRKSTDGGATWVNDTSQSLPHYPATAVSRTLVAVTPANPNVIYVIYVQGGGYYGLFKSTNGGASWKQQSARSGTNIIAYQGDYDLVLAVSPLDENLVLAGGPTMYKSTDGGAHWSSTGFELHYDLHALAFAPGSGTTIYCGNDGGLYRTTNASAAWNSISNGLQISQYYRAAGSVTNPALLYVGAQDNGFHRYDGAGWTSAISGADGTGCVVDYSDENSVFLEYQQGYLLHSSNGGGSFDLIAPDSNGNWIAPLAQHPTNHQLFFAAYRELYSTSDAGVSWKKLSPNLTGNDPMKSLAIAPSNDKYMYMGTYVKIFRTTNGGTTWTDIGAGLPIGDTAALTSICVHPSNPRWAWITFAGFSDGLKVFRTTDAGATWTNISGTLPNVSVNCIVYQKNSTDVLFIGTDLGVFYRDNTTSDWAPFNDGLPNVSVLDLQIQYTMQAMRAATFGRGVWQTPLPGAAAPAAPVLASPANDTTGLPIAFTLRWNAAARAATYDVQVSTDSTFATITKETSGLTGTSYSVSFLARGVRHFWRVAGSNAVGAGPWSAVHRFTTAGSTAVNDIPSVPATIVLEQNYPNPFTTGTAFRFALPARGRATLVVTNLLGETVATPFDAVCETGTHEIPWDASQLPAGMYLANLTAAGQRAVRTISVMK